MTERMAESIFIIKCGSGVALCYFLYNIWPKYQFDLAMISVLFGLSFENSRKQAVDAILSNVLGCAIALFLLLLPLPGIWLLSFGVILVVVLGYGSGLGEMIKPALAALVIVLLQQERTIHWFGPLQSVFSLLTGCAVAIVLTVMFDFWLPKDVVSSPEDRISSEN